MQEIHYWLEGKFVLTDLNKKQEMNNLILELLRKTGIGQLTTKKINGKEVPVFATAEPDKHGIVKFDYSLFEGKKREGNFYNTNSCELITMDGGNQHFGLTMNLIMTVLESYSETPYFLMKNSCLCKIDNYAFLIDSLTGVKLDFPIRSKAFDTVIYFRQFEKYRDFEYGISELPWEYGNVDKKQYKFLKCDLRDPIEKQEDSELDFEKEVSLLCMQFIKWNQQYKDELLEYIKRLMDMSLTERIKEAEAGSSFSFIASVSRLLPAPYLVKIYAEAFDMEFFELWFQIGKTGYWDVVVDQEKEEKSEKRYNVSNHLLYKMYELSSEDDFLGIWENQDFIFSETMKRNLEEYKKFYFTVEESELTDFNMITELAECLEMLHTIWKGKKYISKDLLEELERNRNDIRYKKTVYVLKKLINNKMEFFSELTYEQACKWIMKSVNRKQYENFFWGYLDFLSNKSYRKKEIGF